MKKVLLLHPIVFALYPIFTLRVKNAEQIKLSDILSTAGIILVLLCIVWYGVYLATKHFTNKHVAERCSMVTSMFFLLFFSYGHIVNWLVLAAFTQPGLEKTLNSGVGIISLIALWIGLLAAFIYLIFKTRLDMQMLNNFYAAMAAVMAFFVLSGSIRSQLSTNENIEQEFIQAWQTRLEAEFPAVQENQAAERLPDIYYIILDGYARQDILQEMYLYDNSDFIDFLSQRGFYVAKDSLTNYPQTVLSLTSSLNFMYMNEMPMQMDVSMKALWPLRAMARDNRLFRFLKQKGYLIRSIPTGFFFTEILNADITVVPENRLNAFQVKVLDITPVPTVAHLLGLQDQSDRFRNRILYGFENIPAPMNSYGIDHSSQPTLTFVHIVSPHPPFVFDAQGGAVPTLGLVEMLDGDLFVGNPDDYVDGYREQVIFVTQKIKGVIDQLIAQADHPLIIILQSDHGPGSRLVWNDWQKTYLPERMSILNAYYFYDQNYARLYSSITPVNSFRIILDQYFGAQYELLEDRNYFASLGSPYAITDITEYLTTP